MTFPCGSLIPGRSATYPAMMFLFFEIIQNFLLTFECTAYKENIYFIPEPEEHNLI